MKEAATGKTQTLSTTGQRQDRTRAETDERASRQTDESCDTHKPVWSNWSAQAAAEFRASGMLRKRLHHLQNRMQHVS